MKSSPPVSRSVDKPLPDAGPRARGIIFKQLMLGIFQGLFQLLQLPLFLFRRESICDQMRDLIQSSSDRPSQD
ncbi:MAG: hypothetical protein VX404_05675 [Planctomycetota bacterium]|nr:hypothetical protein [Planctomycetota bacterium]